MEIGEKFGRWTVIGPAAPRTYERRRGGRPLSVLQVECECICGTRRAVSTLSLKRRASTSCGCFQIDASIARHFKHGGVLGGKSSPEYSAFRSMIARCYNPRNPRYADYGGRGIQVSDEWRSDFAKFLAHVGTRPTARHSIDRMNNERHYEPGNVRWALPHQQMTNRRNSRFVDVNGVRTPLSEIAVEFGIPANTLRARILKGWPLDRATNTPVRAKRPPSP